MGGTAGGHPAIKMKVLEGTTAATQGGTTTVSHGIASNKIISVNVLVEWLTGNFIPNNNSVNLGFSFDYYVQTSDIGIYNNPTNSASILSKPFKVTIFYTE